MKISVPSEDSRRRSILEAALDLFARYGYRKTSMEELAQAAQISRQGLYLHFASKEALFRAMVLYVLERSLKEAMKCFEDRSLPLKDRVVAAMEEWEGKHIGLLGSHYMELLEAAHLHVGEDLLGEYERRLVEAMTAALAEGGPGRGDPPLGVPYEQWAEVLRMASYGLKSFCKTREEFRLRFDRAAHVILTPYPAS